MKPRQARSHEELNRERAEADRGQARFFIVGGLIFCAGGRWDGWIFRQHPDGYLVSDRKADRVEPKFPAGFEPSRR